MKPLTEKLKSVEHEINQKNTDYVNLTEEKIQI